MSDLATFLRARLAEDEQAAREAQPGPWHIGNAVDPTQPCNVHTFPTAGGVADGLRWLDAEHIVRHAPARVLAEVEAKRRIINEHQQATPGWCATCDIPGDYKGLPEGCMTVRLLALPYADHSVYREEWRP